MTCVNCEYQWCWLCEGEYKYGHYESGKCQGQQFAKADFPMENKINNNNNNNNLNDNNINHRIYINRRNYGFGLHKIFKCVFPIIIAPYDDYDNLCIKYLCILGFWLFSYLAIYLYIIINWAEKKIHGKHEDFFFIISLLMGITFFLPFQIYFTCLTTPFILISIIYHHFFEYFLIIFGLGHNAQNYYYDR